MMSLRINAIVTVVIVLAIVATSVRAFELPVPTDPTAAKSVVPLYTFEHANILFIGLQDGYVIGCDSQDGEELWRLDTGGSMVRSQVLLAPSSSVRSEVLHSLPFGVRGQWLYSRTPSGSLSENPFMHITQLLQSPHFTQNSTDFITTTSASHYDVDDKGLRQGNRPFSTTSPIVHIMRYNVHVHARSVLYNFEWNITIGTIKMSLTVPNIPGQEAAWKAFSENRYRTMISSKDGGLRPHVEFDSELDTTTFWHSGSMQWRKALNSVPVAAFQWVGTSIMPIDVLGADSSNQFHLSHSIGSPSSALVPTPPHVPATTSTKVTPPTPPPVDSEEQWTSVSRMHIFVITSSVVYILVIMTAATAVMQRSKLRQAWQQLDELQAALLEQQRNFSTSQPSSTKLDPQPSVPLSSDAESLADTEDTWELPQSHTGSLAPLVSPSRDTSLFGLHFTVIRKIGGGGGGVVYEAKHKLTSSTYAIKVIALRGDEERVKREAVLHAKLEHKNVVRFFYCWVEELQSEILSTLGDLDGEDDDRLSTVSTMSSSPTTPVSNGPPKFVFIQMEYFSNGTLADFLVNRKGMISREENLSLILMIVRGLEYIHSCGIVHRDLKPTNIFLSDDLVAKIGDFGLSYASGQRELAEAAYTIEGAETFGVGSPLYSSPEQLETGKATVLSDVYSLGVLAFEMYHDFGTSHERIACLQRFRQGHVDAALAKKYPEEIELFLAMTQATPATRPTLKTVHETLKKLLKSLRG